MANNMADVYEANIHRDFGDRIVGAVGGTPIQMKNAKAAKLVGDLEDVPKILSIDGEVDATLCGGDVREVDARARASMIAKKVTKIVQSYVGQPNTLKTHGDIADAICAELDLGIPGAEMVDGQVGKDDNGVVNIGVVVKLEPYVKELKCHFLLSDENIKVTELERKTPVDPKVAAFEKWKKKRGVEVRSPWDEEPPF